MGQRMVRVNELLRRELSEQLHTTYRSEAVMITITDVDISPDLRSGVVYYSVLGGKEDSRNARNLFRKIAGPLRQAAIKRVLLKYTPFLKFVEDTSMQRGARTVGLLEDIDVPEETEENPDNT
ncbi:MAG: 30S ribosome-binding factor RbfA [Verrucomicrobiota bacterium]